MLSSSFCLLSLSLGYTLLAAQASVVIPRDNSRRTPGSRTFKFDAQRQRRADNSNNNDSSITLTNQDDVIYYTNLNVGGQDIQVNIDTGSSDIWVKSPTKDLQFTNQTDIHVNLTYGLGTASGSVAYTSVSFGNYHVQNQAVLNVNNTKDFPISGILGLGLDRLSTIYEAANKHSGHVVPEAQSVLSNIFDQHPDEHNFIGLYLERSKTAGNTSGGALSISEYYPDYSAIANSTKFPLIQGSNASRWTISLGGVTVNKKSLPLTSTVHGVAANSSVALIDSGTSLGLIPEAVVDLIYGSIDGAVRYTTGGERIWLVPCLNQANISFTFSGQTFAINPLELSRPENVTSGGKQYTICASSFRPLDKVEGQFDCVLGDIFMRNVYSVFNFGDTALSSKFTGPPSIQFYSLTDEADAYKNFASQRNTTLKNYPPLLDLKNINGTQLQGIE